MPNHYIRRLPWLGWISQMQTLLSGLLLLIRPELFALGTWMYMKVRWGQPHAMRCLWLHWHRPASKSLSSSPVFYLAVRLTSVRSFARLLLAHCSISTFICCVLEPLISIRIMSQDPAKSTKIKQQKKGSPMASFFIYPCCRFANSTNVSVPKNPFSSKSCSVSSPVSRST